MTTRILVVDDERDIESLFRQMFRRELRSGTVEFAFAFSAQEAIAALEGEDPARFVLILSDINMPGMSGLELLARIREQHPDRRVVMVTAYGDQATRERAMSLGASGFLTKPIDFAELRAAVQEQM